MTRPRAPVCHPSRRNVATMDNRGSPAASSPMRSVLAGGLRSWHRPRDHARRADTALGAAFGSSPGCDRRVPHVPQCRLPARLGVCLLCTVGGREHAQCQRLICTSRRHACVEATGVSTGDGVCHSDSRTRPGSHAGAVSIRCIVPASMCCPRCHASAEAFRGWRFFAQLS
jgi:hypothetical protein